MADRKAGSKPKIVRKPHAVKTATADTAVAIVEAAKAARPVATETPAPAPAKPVETPKAERPAPPVAEASAPVAEAPQVEASSRVENEAKPEVQIESGAKSMTETINNTINKAQESTQQAAQQATEQFRGALNDVNERGKVAMEKGARIVEEMADLTRGNLEAMVASQKTAAKFAETLTQGAADYSRRSFEEASTALRSFADAKSPADIFRLQSDFARSAFDAMVAESARVSETVVKMSGEVAEPITSRYSVAAERLKAVAA